MTSSRGFDVIGLAAVVVVVAVAGIAESAVVVARLRERTAR